MWRLVSHFSLEGGDCTLFWNTGCYQPFLMVIKPKRISSELVSQFLPFESSSLYQNKQPKRISSELVSQFLPFESSSLYQNKHLPNCNTHTLFLSLWKRKTSCSVHDFFVDIILRSFVSGLHSLLILCVHKILASAVSPNHCCISKCVWWSHAKSHLSCQLHNGGDIHV
jgi:hypothetical protein